MSYDTYNPGNDPFFLDSEAPRSYIQATPKSAEGTWPDHCRQSQSNRKFGLFPFLKDEYEQRSEK